MRSFLYRPKDSWNLLPQVPTSTATSPDFTFHYSSSKPLYFDTFGFHFMHAAFFRHCGSSLGSQKPSHFIKHLCSQLTQKELLVSTKRFTQFHLSLGFQCMLLSKEGLLTVPTFDCRTQVSSLSKVINPPYQKPEHKNNKYLADNIQVQQRSAETLQTHSHFLSFIFSLFDCQMNLVQI